MEIHKLSAEERFEANLISIVAFHMRVEDKEKIREESLKEEPKEDWGAFSEDGKIMARIINNRYDTWLEGQLVINGGIFGMGLASSLSYYAAVIVGLGCFLKKDCIFRFQRCGLKYNMLCRIISSGKNTRKYQCFVLWRNTNIPSVPPKAPNRIAARNSVFSGTLRLFFFAHCLSCIIRKKLMIFITSRIVITAIITGFIPHTLRI